MSRKQLDGLQAASPEHCLVPLFVLPCCLGRGFPEGPLPSLAGGRCWGRDRDSAEAAASLPPAVNSADVLLLSGARPQPGTFVSNSSCKHSGFPLK